QAVVSFNIMLVYSMMFWNTEPRSLSSIGVLVRSLLSTNTRPSVGVHIPATILIRVVFPHPEGPRMVTYSPSCISKFTCSSAFILPKFFETPSSLILGMCSLHLQCYLQAFTWDRVDNSILRLES